MLTFVPTLFSSGGHFARRSPEPVSAAPPAPVAKPPATPVSDLLAPRRGARPRPPPAIGLPVGLPTAPAPPSPQRTPFAEVPRAPEQSLGDRVEAAFQETFLGVTAAPRVLASFRRLRAGDEYVQLWPGLGVQRAESYVEGLTATPFPNAHGGAYPWLEAVERNAAVIQEEFLAAIQDQSSLEARGNKVWVPAARAEALSYGPSWRTLVLQDRGIWEETNSKLFPRTKQLLTDLAAPTLEVFFARQDGKTGIKSHTDNANFVQTSHLGIDVPEGECWIKVGDFTREWRNGKVLVCDTSFMHETENTSDQDRYILILRHWHPELTELERIATLFLFASLDDSTPAGIKAAQKAAAKRLKALAGAAAAGGKNKKGGSGSTGGGGFGKRVA